MLVVGYTLSYNGAKKDFGRQGSHMVGGGAGEPMPNAVDARLAVACGLGVAMRSYQFWLLNNGILPEAASVYEPVAWVQVAGVVVELLVLVAAMRAPRPLAPRPLLIGALACCLSGVAVLEVVGGMPAGVAVGLVVRLIGFLLGAYTLGIALSCVGDMRVVAIVASLAVLAATFVAAFAPAPGFRVSVALDAVLTLCTLALTWRAAEPILARTAKAPGGSLQALASPRSFLLPNNQLFVLILIFSIAVGFGSSLRSVAFVPQTSRLGIVVLTGVVAWFLLRPAGRGREREDTLFTASALLVVAGFLATPLEGLGAGVANSLLYDGRLSFGILSWTTLAALCARNPDGAVMALACSELASGAGALLGTGLGNLCNVLLGVYPEAAAIMMSAAVLALFAYVLDGLRGFSFAGTIRGVEPPAPLPLPEELIVPLRGESLDTACDKLAVERSLTNREREVLGMLARGHNGYHVRDELSLSYNTVKTYVKRIYQKLDVHSQQELIDLVENRAEEGATPGGAVRT